MLSIYLGPDDFSKKEQVKSLAEKARLEVDFFYGQEQLPTLGQLTEQDLFSTSRIFVVEEGIDRYDLSGPNVDLLAGSSNHIIFVEEKLDKRIAQNKKLLDNKKITVTNFMLPHGREVNKWIEKRVALLGGRITPKASELLAKKIGRDEAKETKFGGKVVEVKEIYDLWQLNGEVNKLVSFAQNRQIEEPDVENLVEANEEADVLGVIDLIGEGKREASLKLLGKFLNNELASDEKTKIIQFNALLSSQFRGIYMVQGFLSEKMPDDKILEKTSWKSGRLFVMKRIAAKFNSLKVLETLKKLEALDEELKSSPVPPKVLLDLIVAQMF